MKMELEVIVCDNIIAVNSQQSYPTKNLQFLNWILCQRWSVCLVDGLNMVKWTGGASWSILILYFTSVQHSRICSLLK